MRIMDCTEYDERYDPQRLPNYYSGLRTSEFEVLVNLISSSFLHLSSIYEAPPVCYTLGSVLYYEQK